MSDISQWSVADASNNAAAPDGFPEGMAPSEVNDAARAVMGALARYYQGVRGGVSTTGSSGAYVITSSSSHALLADVGLVFAKPNHSNTGAATLNVDALGAKAIEKNGAALVGGEIISGATYGFVYNSGADAFELIGGVAISDSIGKLRRLPSPDAQKTGSYTLDAGDVGCQVLLGTSGAITIPDAVLAADDVITIVNQTAVAATITNTITTAYVAGADAATATLSAYGLCVIAFTSGTVCHITGDVA